MKYKEAAHLRFLVLGAARSGIAAAKLLKGLNADVVVADSKSVDQAIEAKAELDALGISSVWGDEQAISAVAGRDILVKSPGIPQNSPLVQAAVAGGARVISEIELASAVVSEQAKIIAITGTNGKTTTTAWLTHVLNKCGYQAIPAGNIGDAWSAQLNSIPIPDIKRAINVVEVSSFQLENLEDFHPDVAVLTNISPDHMDRYDDRLDLYIAAKANIVRNMHGSDVFIWNLLDADSRGIAEAASCEKRGFAGQGLPAGAAAWVQDKQIFAQTKCGPAAILSTEDLPLPGYHNLENALCVVLAALAVGAEPAAVRPALKSFPGVEHRIEFCGTRPDGVRFYNDSKATNLDAMEKAVQAFKQPIVLIAGGRDAHSDYPSISHLIKEHVFQLITVGEAAQLIEDAWGHLVPTKRAASMAQAVELANDVAEPGMAVVFSPACKSFDMYFNYEERGRDFKHEVKRVLAGLA